MKTTFDLVEKLQADLSRTRRVKALVQDKKASVGMLLRPKTGSAATSLKDCEMFFILRALRKGDRWGGHVGFPGGRQAPNESDFDTCTREIKEEIGIQVDKHFVCLGQLNDRAVGEEPTRLIIKTFVFFQHSESTRDEFEKELSIHDVEVQACGWCPIEKILKHENKKLWNIELSNFLPQPKLSATFLTHILQLKQVCFTMISLPISPLYYKDRDACSQEDLLLKDQRLLNDFNLWGLTLSMVNDFLFNITKYTDVDLYDKDGLKLPFGEVFVDKVFPDASFHNFGLKITKIVFKKVTGEEPTMSQLFGMYPVFLSASMIAPGLLVSKIIHSFSRL